MFLSMRNAPAIIVLGYGVAAVAAWMIAGASLAALALFWVGGAIATLGLALAAARRARGEDAHRSDEEENALLAVALRRWEEDRVADARAEAPGAATRAG